MRAFLRISVWQMGRVVALAGMALLGGGAASDAEATHIACGAVLGPGGSFVLDSNFGPCPGVALTLVGPVTLDMRGREVSCADGAFGVIIEGRGAQLRNGVIDNCIRGVELTGYQHRVTRVTVFPRSAGGTAEGFSVFGTGRHVLTGNTVFCWSPGRGVEIFSDTNTLSLNYVECETGYLVRGNRNTFTRNDAETSRVGFEVGGDLNILTSNNAEGSEVSYQIEGVRNVLRSNTAGNDVAGVGFSVIGNLNQLYHNVSSTAGRGFVVDSDQNRLVGNSIGFNDDAAITVTGQSNLLQNNRASEPIAGPALIDTNASCDANRWMNNTGSGNQPCVK
jgi:hypothetical protein